MNSRSLVVQRPPDRPQQLILLFHGYGADAADLLPLAERLAGEFPRSTVVSIAAPHAAGNPVGHQWFPTAGVTDAGRKERVAQAMPAFLAEIAGWQHEVGVAESATALVGFSQGAIMALEASAGPTPPAGRVAAICGRYAMLPDAAPAHTTIHLLHGEEDAVIPYRHTIDAAHRLVELGGDVTADVIPFLGHGINEELAATLVQRLSRYVPRRLWDEAMRGQP